MPYTPVLATLGYVLSPDQNDVLMIHRNARAGDHAWDKYNGLGGKMEPGEDVAACMRRELREEANIEATTLRLRGTISWPGFGKRGEDWLGFVFLIPSWTGVPLTQNPEGTLEWIPVEKLLRFDLNLWPGDRYFLPLVFDANPIPFHGVMPYENGRPVRWDYSRG